MPATDYHKPDVTAFADSVDELIAAISGDGVGMDDLGNLIETVTTGAAAVNEMQGVPAAAGLHIAGRIADKQGDRLLAKAIADEAAGG